MPVKYCVHSLLSGILNEFFFKLFSFLKIFKFLLKLHLFILCTCVDAHTPQSMCEIWEQLAELVVDLVMRVPETELQSSRFLAFTYSAFLLDQSIHSFINIIKNYVFPWVRLDNCVHLSNCWHKDIHTIMLQPVICNVPLYISDVGNCFFPEKYFPDIIYIINFSQYKILHSSIARHSGTCL